ncbi:MAG: YidC/Oxa1 family insertase periplasmic-domain containing protein, partial [Cyclonatronaceae bacterium]
MDRNQFIGIILITAVMFAWMYYMAPSDAELERMQREQAARDSLDAIAQAEGFESDEQRRDAMPDTGEETDRAEASSLGSFANTTATDTLLTTVETPYYRMLFTTVGGGPAQVELLQHDKYDGTKVNLLADTLRSAYSVGFLSTENYNIDSHDLLFKQRHSQQDIRLEAGEEQQLIYDLELEDGRTLTFEYTISGDGYQLGLDIYFDGMRELVSGSYYEFGWQPRLRTTEESRDQESQYSAAYVYLGGVLENLQLTEAGSERESITG